LAGGGASADIWSVVAEICRLVAKNLKTVAITAELVANSTNMTRFTVTKCESMPFLRIAFFAIIAIL
jgi:hypothetical protein